jgi:CPA2 family monovalent cation:H+ antiporter-2/glutathione-regulated potassium-efflux system protein KefB
MDAVGVDGAEIDRTEAEYRRTDIARLKAQKETGDLYAGREGIFSQASAAAAAAEDRGDG